MADITIQVPVTIPDAYTARALAWPNSKPPLMQASGEVDEFGDPIMEEVSETAQVKLLRILGEFLRAELKARLRRYEERAAAASVTDVEVG